jgi:hypothetical protein
MNLGKGAVRKVSRDAHPEDKRQCPEESSVVGRNFRKVSRGREDSRWNAAEKKPQGREKRRSGGGAERQKLAGA